MGIVADGKITRIDFTSGDVMILYKRPAPGDSIEVELVGAREYAGGPPLDGVPRVILKFDPRRGTEALGYALKQAMRQAGFAERPTWARILGVQASDDLSAIELAHRHKLSECHPGATEDYDEMERQQRRAGRLNWALIEARRAKAREEKS